MKLCSMSWLPQSNRYRQREINQSKIKISISFFFDCSPSSERSFLLFYLEHQKLRFFHHMLCHTPSSCRNSDTMVAPEPCRESVTSSLFSLNSSGFIGITAYNNNKDLHCFSWELLAENILFYKLIICFSSSKVY